MELREDELPLLPPVPLLLLLLGLLRLLELPRLLLLEPLDVLLNELLLLPLLLLLGPLLEALELSMTAALLLTATTAPEEEEEEEDEAATTMPTMMRTPTMRPTAASTARRLNLSFFTLSPVGAQPTSRICSDCDSSAAVADSTFIVIIFTTEARRLSVESEVGLTAEERLLRGEPLAEELMTAEEDAGTCKRGWQKEREIRSRDAQCGEGGEPGEEKGTNAVFLSWCDDSIAVLK